MDSEVTVPFVRADGDEVVLRMTVEMVQAGDRRVFVAEMSEPA
jgi:hypothetical protein